MHALASSLTGQLPVGTTALMKLFCSVLTFLPPHPFLLCFSHFHSIAVCECLYLCVSVTRSVYRSLPAHQSHLPACLRSRLGFFEQSEALNFSPKNYVPGPVWLELTCAPAGVSHDAPLHPVIILEVGHVV